MIGTESLFAISPATAYKAARPLRSDPGLGKAQAKFVERCRNIVMIGTQSFLSDRQRPLIERLGLCVAALIVVESARLLSDNATSR